ncbi:uncharacterized protein MELLADRAFT_110306 [Melampsora larici-populina 98AG31]|uniref:Uncharacterized protein n=1 Tax=Melampsora larici-populina (strain 98AG31 / pathotype 3-4-7) TaxID=747676 RepID=F4RZB9_MELLP|nr:uncharacterized protein MELLADRAFT_110306 [Melampsora larici-populina 98AG31]EGG02280.1 hypothetical protein MELLADRAFT_110306 [Melampsora larici-populina 98AG31]
MTMRGTKITSRGSYESVEQVTSGTIASYKNGRTALSDDRHNYRVDPRVGIMKYYREYAALCEVKERRGSVNAMLSGRFPDIINDTKTCQENKGLVDYWARALYNDLHVHDAHITGKTRVDGQRAERTSGTSSKCKNYDLKGIES